MALAFLAGSAIQKVMKWHCGKSLSDTLVISLIVEIEGAIYVNPLSPNIAKVAPIIFF